MHHPRRVDRLQRLGEGPPDGPQPVAAQRAVIPDPDVERIAGHVSGDEIGTRAVDIGAKEEIYRIIRSLADDGAVVVINSSEDSELVALCDRVLVLYEGAVVETLAATDLTEERLVGSSMRVPATTAEEAE